MMESSPLLIVHVSDGSALAPRRRRQPNMELSACEGQAASVELPSVLPTRSALNVSKLCFAAVEGSRSTRYSMSRLGHEHASAALQTCPVKLEEQTS